MICTAMEGQASADFIAGSKLPPEERVPLCDANISRRHLERWFSAGTIFIVPNAGGSVIAGLSSLPVSRASRGERFLSPIGDNILEFLLVGGG